MLKAWTTRRNSRRGLTLIEILIALIILLVGLVGIFALFPVGIRSTQESVEDSTAALLAESFHHALIGAMRASPPGQTGVRVPVALVHDGCSGYSAVGGGGPSPNPSETNYIFELPSDAGSDPSPTIFTYPRPNQGSPGAPSRALFRMADRPQQGGAQTYVRACIMGTTGTNRNDALPGSVWREDPSEGLDQYYVSFDVIRVRDAAGSAAQPLFEFRIGVYRNYTDRSPTWPINTNAGGSPAAWPQAAHPDLRKDFRTLIAGN